MLRAVLDTNVLVSAILSRRGAPAALLRAWRDGEFEVVVSPSLLDELRRVLAYPKLRRRIGAEEAEAFVALFRAAAEHHDDPGGPASVRSRDAADDFLLALAEASSAYLVTGDDDLLELADVAPVLAPAALLEQLGADFHGFDPFASRGPAVSSELVKRLREENGG